MGIDPKKKGATDTKKQVIPQKDTKGGTTKKK